MDADLYALSTTELTAVLTQFETERRRSEFVVQQIVGQVVERGIAGDYARTSSVDLLVQLLRVSPREAKARVDRARDLGPRRDVIGEPLEPILAETFSAPRSRPTCVGRCHRLVHEAQTARAARARVARLAVNTLDVMRPPGPRDQFDPVAGTGAWPRWIRGSSG